MTVFGTGAPPTVTVTPLPQMITQLTTVTVNNAAAAAPSSIPAGVSPPAGAAAGTGASGSKTAGIVKTSNAAAGNVRKYFYPKSSVLFLGTNQEQHQQYQQVSRQQYQQLELEHLDPKPPR
jgi:hypothetical protein